MDIALITVGLLFVGIGLTVVSDAAAAFGLLLICGYVLAAVAVFVTHTIKNFSSKKVKETPKEETPKKKTVKKISKK